MDTIGTGVLIKKAGETKVSPAFFKDHKTKAEQKQKFRSSL